MFSPLLSHPTHHASPKRILFPYASVIHIHDVLRAHCFFHRMFPVDICYLLQPVPDYLRSTVDTVMRIHVEEPPGDILAFLPGQDDVCARCDVCAKSLLFLMAHLCDWICPLTCFCPHAIGSAVVLSATACLFCSLV